MTTAKLNWKSIPKENDRLKEFLFAERISYFPYNIDIILFRV